VKFSVAHAVEILSNTPDVLQTMLRGVGDAWSHNNYGDDTWSAFDIVGHLIQGEKTDWIPRMQIILEHGESRPFAPFDRFAQVQDSKGKTLAQLLAEFNRLRTQNLETLLAAKLSDKDFHKRGTHPALGRVTIGELLAAWVVHDLNHVAQTAKAMAFQYHDQVGPWHAYLSILGPPNPR